jgi:2TM domain
MEPTFEEQARLDKARKKVKAIKGFYSHLAAYVIVNVVLIVMHTVDLKPDESFWTWSTFSTAFFWGIGLLCHAFGVFGAEILFGNDWEERKIKEYMEKKPQSYKKWE